MILLTRLDGHSIGVNDALIVFAEATPDTVITMMSGQRLLVKEPLSELIQLVAAARRGEPGRLPPAAEEVHHG
ncbi:MAG: flagellar FlbD family protein [Myxococcota bacterium]